MRSPLKPLAVLVASLGLTVAVNAEPAKSAPVKSKAAVEKVAKDPKPVGLDPKPVLPAKPDPAPKVELPKPPLPSKFETKLPLPSKVEPKLEPKPSVILPPAGPVVTDKKPTVPIIKPGIPDLKPDIKTPVKPVDRPVLVNERPKVTGPVDLPKGPGLKLPKDVKFDQTELTKIKPPVDLTKTKPETVLGSKPPADFKIQPIKLENIHVPQNAVKMDKLNVTNVAANQSFVLNQNFYTGGNYHTKFGTQMASGFYCYPGQHHSHWHHCIYDPCFKTNYFYCPSACCYYYWCAGDYCYYPCHWFVNYGPYYYPWWICGGFGGYGYGGTPFVSIHIGW